MCVHVFSVFVCALTFQSVVLYLTYKLRKKQKMLQPDLGSNTVVIVIKWAITITIM